MRHFPKRSCLDRRKRLQLDIGFDLASDSEGEGFGHILARADETADGYAVRHHIEERNREFAWGQSDQDASTTLPGHTDALLECNERRRRNQNAMGSAAGRLLDSGCRVSNLGIDHEIGTKVRGMGQVATAPRSSGPLSSNRPFRRPRRRRGRHPCGERSGAGFRDSERHPRRLVRTLRGSHRVRRPECLLLRCAGGRHRQAHPIRYRDEGPRLR